MPSKSLDAKANCPLPLGKEKFSSRKYIEETSKQSGGLKTTQAHVSMKSKEEEAYPLIWTVYYTLNWFIGF